MLKDNLKIACRASEGAVWEENVCRISNFDIETFANEIHIKSRDKKIGVRVENPEFILGGEGVHKGIEVSGKDYLIFIDKAGVVVNIEEAK
jgi:hypothetical protein